MVSIPLEQFQNDPESLLSRIAAGERVVVTRGDVPVAEVRPVQIAPKPPRRAGSCKGMFTVPDDFDAPLPEDLLRAFEGQ